MNSADRRTPLLQAVNGLDCDTAPHIDLADLRTDQQICEEMPWFTMNKLRYLYANRKTNGTEEAGVWAWIGHKRAVVRSALIRWVNKQQAERTN